MTTDGGWGDFDPAVRDRVIGEIEAFEDALDEAERHPTAEAWDRLGKAADRLMRAVAAVLIELEGKQAPDGAC